MTIRPLTSCESLDRKSTRLNSSHPSISYAVFCLKKKKIQVERYNQEKIIEIVSNAARESPNRLHFLCLAKLVLAVAQGALSHFALGNVVGHAAHDWRCESLGSQGIVVFPDPAFPTAGHQAEISLIFFFNATSTTVIYTLSLHDALPI